MFITDDVTSVNLDESPKVVKGGDETYTANSVVLAMGSAYRELRVPGEKELSGHGVSWCATCDGFFFCEQGIVVVGGGDSALEEATFLTRFARTVTIAHRRDSLRASRIMQRSTWQRWASDQYTAVIAARYSPWAPGRAGPHGADSAASVSRRGLPRVHLPSICPSETDQIRQAWCAGADTLRRPRPAPLRPHVHG